jgi:hypothetical protein
MPLPEHIVSQYTAEDAGYLAMSAVVKQDFRLDELIDMVVQAAGKDVSRVQHVLQAGSVHYHGYHYRWPGFAAAASELAPLLARLPDDDPERAFDPALVTAAVFETGGGAQVVHVELQKKEGAARKIWRQRSPWNVLLDAASEAAPRYDRYDYARHGDLFRMTLSYERGVKLLKEMSEAAPRALRRRWNLHHPPSAIFLVSPRMPSAARAAKAANAAQA